ncbi:MAG TPA: phosphatase PAP2 family protein [Alphaproteobacteria bacterium]|nr:phosphatase PAP2 family protein [Alphaproteobacteria bacterium]
MSIKEIIYDWGGLNTQLFYLINNIQSALYHKFMVLGTMLGETKIFPVYILLILGFAYYALKRRKNLQATDYPEYRERWLKAITVITIGFFMDVLWVWYLKGYLEMPRPFIALPVGTVTQLVNESPFSSFPSGHSCFAMLLAAGLWPMLGKIGKTIAVFYVVWVAFSRLAVGVHFPADVVGTLLLSFLVVCIVRLLVNRIYLFWSKHRLTK